ncbi:hypothetical protein VP01_10561g2, partial [Puccinia sorghi]
FQAFLNRNTGTMVTVLCGSVRQTLPSVATEGTQIAQLHADCRLHALEYLNPLLIIKKIVGAVQASYSVMVRACSFLEDLLGYLPDVLLIYMIRTSAIVSITKVFCFPTDTSMGQARQTILLYVQSCLHCITNVFSEARIFFTQIFQHVQSVKFSGKLKVIFQ